MDSFREAASNRINNTPNKGQYSFINPILPNSNPTSMLQGFTFSVQLLRNAHICLVSSSHSINNLSLFSLSVCDLVHTCVSSQDYRSVIENLPEDDRPAFFGLPANIERSSQRIISSQVHRHTHIDTHTATCFFSHTHTQTPLPLPAQPPSLPCTCRNANAKGTHTFIHIHSGNYADVRSLELMQSHRRAHSSVYMDSHKAFQCTLRRS